MKTFSQKLKDRLIQLDQFGALFTLSIQGNSSQFKSALGAFATLLLYSCSLVYFVYLMYVWLDDQLLPKTVNTVIFQENGSHFLSKSSPISVNFEYYNENLFETIKNKKMFTTSYFQFKNEFEKMIEDYNPDCSSLANWTTPRDVFRMICIDKDQEIEFQQNPKDRMNDRYIVLAGYQCDQNDPSCEYFELSQELFNPRLTIFMQQYNYNTQQLITIPQDYYFKFYQDQKTVFNVKLQIAELIIQKGFLFPSQERMRFIEKIDVQTSTTPSSFEQSEYFNIILTLARQENHILVQYPMFPEVMAQFSSVFSVLMALGILFSWVNNFKMRQTLLNSLGEQTFMEYNRVNIQETRNIRESDLKGLQKEMLDKCNIVSILYEIAKIQLALQTIFTKDQMIEIQKMKYRIKLTDEERKSQFRSQLFDRSNFLIFSKSEIEKTNQVHQKQQSTNDDKDAIQRLIRLNQTYLSNQSIQVVNQFPQSDHKDQDQYIDQVN